MFFTLQELVRWLRMTAFELWLHVLSILVFSVLAVLKEEGVLVMSWWLVFTPLFACEALNAYLCVIVLIRAYLEVEVKTALFRFVMSSLYVSLLFLFKLLLCQHLSGHRDMSMSGVISPLFVLLMILMFRACRTH